MQNLIFQMVIPAIMALLGFTLIVSLHEFGHLLAAKCFGVKAPTFSIGWGPRLFSTKIKNTDFQVSLIPAGGYVEIFAPDQKELSSMTKEEKNVALTTKPYWQKMIISGAGIAINLLSAYILYSAIFAICGKPQRSLASLVINQVIAGGTSEGSLEANTKIIGINNRNFADTNTTDKDFFQLLQAQQGSNIELLIAQEDNTTGTVNLTLPQERPSSGWLGLSLQPEYKSISFEKMTLRQAISSAIETTNSQIVEILSGLKNMFAKKSTTGLAGPVMILYETFKQAQAGILNFILLLASLSVGFAVLNILPLGVLDGGRMLLDTFEAIAGRELNLLKNLVNSSSVLLLLSLILWLSYKELSTLAIGKPGAIIVLAGLVGYIIYSQIFQADE